MAKAPKMTKFEAELLSAVRDSNFHDGRNPVDDAVWTSIATETLGRSAQGAITSAKRKGWLGSQRGTTGVNGDNPGVIWITQAGFEALAAQDQGKPTAVGPVAPIVVEPVQAARFLFSVYSDTEEDANKIHQALILLGVEVDSVEEVQP